MTEKVKLPPALLDHTPWELETNPIWFATSFTLHRNLAKYNFPPKMNELQLQQTSSLLRDQLCQIPQLDHPLFLNAASVDALDKEFLFEHFLCLEGFQNTFNGQGFVVDNSSHFFAEINIDNHLQMHLIDCKGSWENAWNLLSQMETVISNKTDFSFSPKFGYLTSDPALCGTGLTVRAFLHIPALVHTQQLQEALLKQKEEGISFAGMGGTLDDLTGDLLVISNRYTLGESEEGILHAIHSMAMKLMALEKTLSSHLKNENNLEIKDQVSRAFGLLLHSYQLQTKEALNALSLMKLGVRLDWVEGINDEKLNHLFFLSRRAHLLHHLGELQLSDPHEISRRRAELLHKNMQGVSLTFESP